MTESWLRCKVSQGQFSIEYAVSGKRFDGEGFSLFAPKEFVDTPEEVTDETVDGWLRVEILDQKGDLLLIRLPRPTLESGQSLTVNSVDVKKRLVRQKA